MTPMRCRARSFRRDDEHGYAFVCNQPDSEAELELVEKASARCPAGAVERAEQERVRR